MRERDGGEGKSLRVLLRRRRGRERWGRRLTLRSAEWRSGGVASERREMRREEEDGAEHGDSGGFGGFIYIKRAEAEAEGGSLSLSCLADAVGVCGDLVRSLDLNLSLLVGFSSAA